MGMWEDVELELADSMDSMDTSKMMMRVPRTYLVLLRGNANRYIAYYDII